MNTTTKHSPSQYASPDAAIDALVAQLTEVSAETVGLAQAHGRVLAAAVLADRDSPACDVSAMDGYAVRIADLASGACAVEGEASIGQPITSLPAERAMRIFTGGPVPVGADAVIKREDVNESPDRIELRMAADSIERGVNIRRRGENLHAGAEVVARGAVATPAAIGALAEFGVAQPSVYRKVRVGIITTGDELRAIHQPVEPWQIRNSNSAALAALIGGAPWLAVVEQAHARDDRASIASALEDLLPACDALILTGGVSMGDYDFVPDAVRDAGGRVVFHRLPIRPGRPVLGAATPDGKAILGLPGNPVSALVTARRIALPALRTMSGAGRGDAGADAIVRLANPDDRSLGLHWFRPARRIAPDRVELVASKSSGDLASAATAGGFVELRPGESGQGPFPFYSWEAR
jgi:molybdopterin molybdotransferase